MSKIKVLQLIGSLKTGGAETVAMNYYRYVNKQVFDFHYVVFGDEIGDYEEEVKSLGGKVIHLTHPSKGYIKFIFALTKLIRAENYDVIHAHTLLNSGIILFIAKILGVKTRIAHSHSIKNKTNTNIKMKVYETIMRRIINYASTDLLSCSVQAGNFLFGEEIFKKQGIVLNNGIDTFKFKFDPQVRNMMRDKFRLKDKVVIGTVGRLSKVKNHMFLLKIFKELYANNKDLFLMIIGEGEERLEIEKYIEKNNLSKSVLVTGNVNNVNDFLQCMDLFVFPSLYEGLGLAIVEAQCTGLQCIISDQVPEDGVLTSLVTQLSLTDSVGTWIEVIEKSIDELSVRKDYSLHIKTKGYEITLLGEKIEELYLK